MLLAVSTVALAQGKGIYTCVDSHGRRITSDRPITECLDREQHELTSSGTLKRVVPPSYTADERARIDAQKKAEEALQARLAEEKRRDRALLIRYPNQAVHDRERTEALAQIDEVISAVNKRAQTLLNQRKEISAELEFYQNDVSKAPLWLRRKLEDNEQQVVVQQRFVVEQTQEKRRVNARFDEELVKLRQLWGQK
ncbi:DUF4124 domain-containing protein [Hydrogenophaga sp.]|uniref:DUF4124 domain-containing protein n=1 Tax=Hydrogenophaga sp. TaxID=1904254 RepID=UPI00271E03B8|nr:DUF4124 domain-containing protein [Hydrogenophaga sp.]MDO9253218.1 DUF4124 domain-containing protein [Hydrogenophaga sp.]MDP3323733.1 DUF4124 domain-containing protein [Hydrogenophaga sp.]MDP3884346.1 DUF4124 domain-containing protein [Hydrogenophaga sp.]MDZ4174330.1 DUF4124 domain-containing protein [Hydrogenophaga sp.]